MRKMLAVFAAVLALSVGTVRASTNTSEITDMWWNPAESGWGINIILQNDIAFGTFFVYDAAQNPIWYTVTLNYQGNFVWSGDLYATRGPWFGGAFPPSSVSLRKVGTATFSVLTLNSSTLVYSVDGVTVHKSLERQTWKNENLTGSYAGGYSIRSTSCAPSSLNGLQEVSGYLSVLHTGSTFSISATTSGFNCSFNGQYSQTGKLGRVQGTYSCTDSSYGSFLLFEMTPTISGFNARVQGSNQYCQWSGYMGGIKRAN
jgi:hypothetical protein